MLSMTKYIPDILNNSNILMYTCKKRTNTINSLFISLNISIKIELINYI